MARKNDSKFPRYKTKAKTPFSLQQVNMNFGVITSEVHTLSISLSNLEKEMKPLSEEQKRRLMISKAREFKEQNGTTDFEKSRARIHKFGIIQLTSLIEHSVSGLIDELSGAFQIEKWEEKDAAQKKLNILMQITHNLKKVDKTLAEKIEQLPELEFILHYIFLRNVLIHDELDATNAETLKKKALKLQKDHAKHLSGYELSDALSDPTSANMHDFLLLVRSFKNLRTQLPNLLDLTNKQYARSIAATTKFKEFAKSSLSTKIYNFVTDKEDKKINEFSVQYLNQQKLKPYLSNVTKEGNLKAGDKEEIFNELMKYHYKVESKTFSWA